MITAINNNNAAKYKMLFMEAEDYLLGYETVTVFDPAITYYLKNEETGEFNVLEFGNVKDDVKITIFFDTLNGVNGKPGKKIYKKHGRTIEDDEGKGYNASIGITSLEEYFHWLPSIKSIKEIDEKTQEVISETPTKFVILPLDEPHFEIDANTRAIRIPDEFKKHGLAVQGDEFAEVVYFMVDRFFDAMDLNNCDIFIQWETPKRNDGHPTKGVSPVFIRDIESKPGKLIFGWNISEEITKFSGNLKFSVKFFQVKETTVKDAHGESKVVQNVVYSLNTLTGTVAIHPSIGIDLENKDEYIKEEDSIKLFMERIVPSTVVGAGKAADPEFIDQPYADLVLSIDGGYDIPAGEEFVKIYAQATSSDAGVITYDWRCTSLDINNNPTEAVSTVKYNSKTDYVKYNFVSRDELKKETKRIFWILPDPNGEYEIVGNGEVVSAKYKVDEDIPALFERKAYFEVKKPGLYEARAKNRVHNSLSTKMSRTSAIFKRPVEVVMDFNSMKSYGYFTDVDDAKELSAPITDENKKEVGVLSYQWYRSELTSTNNNAFGNGI